jgi:hypothetical protein
LWSIISFDNVSSMAKKSRITDSINLNIGYTEIKKNAVFLETKYWDELLL